MHVCMVVEKVDYKAEKGKMPLHTLELTQRISKISKEKVMI